jgi:hypothetical protein
METRAFSTLSAKVSASAPSCAYPVVVDYIRDSAIRVCERTLAWRYTAPPITLTPGRAEYDFAAPPDTMVQAVVRTDINGTPAQVLSYDAAAAMITEWPATTTVPAEIAELGSEPRMIAQVGANRYRVFPMPDAERTYTLSMTFALKPTRSSSDMDQAVFDEFEDAILHGALQHLLVLPNVDWTDRELAAYHAKQFLFAVTSARAKTNLGAFRSALVVRGPKFA